MKLSVRQLQHFVDDLPSDPVALRHLLDDVGVEVKRVEDHDGDTVFTVELLANRGDHYCYAGVATELAGRTGASVHQPEIAVLDVGDSPWDVRNQTPLCLNYTATLLQRVGDDLGSLSADELACLEAAEIHSINAPIDASNLANIELGQPTHAFDADTIDGPVVIRTTDPGETALPLFADARVTLPEGTLVIADNSKILAIAGVIGCEESKTTASTTRLLLESACFDPVAVRKASRALGLHTDSSARFERGSDPVAPLVGAGRVVQLLESSGAWLRVGDSGQVGLWTDPQRCIRLDVVATNSFLELSLSAGEMASRLRRYGFLVDQGRALLEVLVPPHRLWDVHYPADLWEELAKSVGYNHTPIGLPAVQMGSLPSVAERRKQIAEEVLLGQGFYEVFTDGFYGRSVRERLGLIPSHPLWRHVEVTNALDRDYSLLKNNTLAQALDTVAKALRMRRADVKAYEWTRTFHHRGEGDPAGPYLAEAIREDAVLWAISAGADHAADWAKRARPADVHFLAGVVEELGVALGLRLQLGAGEHPLSDLLHPGRQAVIRLDGCVVGVLGEVHPRLVKAWKIKRARPCFLQIDASALQREGTRPAFVEPPPYHAVVRNLAFTLPLGVQADEVAALMRAEGPDWLDSVEVVDLYEHEEEGRPLRTITYALAWANPGFDVTAEQTNAATEALITAVVAALGARGVRLR